MKRQIRRGVFETNSSSTHSLTICTQDEFEAWKNGELLYNSWDNEFVKGKSTIELTEEEKAEVEKEYNKNRRNNKFMMTWDMLSDEDKQELYNEYAEENYDESEEYTYDRYMYGGYLESYTHRFTTPSGDKMVAFGKYGRDC